MPTASRGWDAELLAHPQRPGGDFIAYGPDLFLAVEVKRASTVSRSDLKGLKAFQTDYPEAERLLLSFCPEPLLIDGIRCEPLEGWLRALRP